MTQYYIIEIQKNVNGEYAHIVHWAYDENETKARLKAESKYHSVLASAAISELPQHSASLIKSDGMCIMNQCYTHEITSQSESESEPEPEGGDEPEGNGE